VYYEMNLTVTFVLGAGKLRLREFRSTMVKFT
jgi:hypothetical protein